MKKESTKLPKMTLVGLKERTNNAAESRAEGGKIGPCVMKYFHEAYPEKIQDRQKPGVTYCVYTEYESDHTGDYSYFIGEEVKPGTEVPEGMDTITIDAQSYTKFTNGPKGMPDVVREAWFQIWDMDEKDFGGKRRYHADFEVYDERAADHDNVVLDIYIGVEG